MMGKWRVLPFARLHPRFWGGGGGGGGGGAGALLFHFILSKILDKISGKFRHIPYPPPQKINLQRRENIAFCPLRGFILDLG